MKIQFFTIFSFIFSLLLVGSARADYIYGHFDSLQLMREEAIKDKNERAVLLINYVQKTKDGEFFEVDNVRSPIEALVIKKTKIKQSKPLESRKEEDILIEYYNRVEEYAESYNQLMNLWLTGEIEDKTAISTFASLNNLYPNFSSSVRAMGVIYLAKDKPQEANKLLNEAIIINERDPIAWTVKSMIYFALGDKNKAECNAFKAKDIDPTLLYLSSWEINYLQQKNPKIYIDWASFSGLR